MHKFLYKLSLFSIFIVLISCSQKKNDIKHLENKTTKSNLDSFIIDCKYTFDQAIAQSNAPKEILDQLQLIDVTYYSTDRKIHSGQVLTNKKLAKSLKIVFHFMFENKFPIAQAIPIVKYNWDDKLSMQANNTYSFCYRNISYSKHASGMAIDINPFFNPVRWKACFENRINRPIGANYDPAKPGTFYSLHPVVQEFKKLGFHWGHNFKEKFDDHHFEL
jgi:hypothetical protein